MEIISRCGNCVEKDFELSRLRNRISSLENLVPRFKPDYYSEVKRLNFEVDAIMATTAWKISLLLIRVFRRVSKFSWIKRRLRWMWSKLQSF
jgi:hypothetical protein